MSLTNTNTCATAVDKEKELLRRLAAILGIPKLHGSITIHFANGEPKTVETKHQRAVGG